MFGWVNICQKKIEPIDVQLKLYDHLREEILQAISTQHRTFIAESFFVSIVFSFSLMGTIFLKPIEGNPIDFFTISSVLAFLIAPAVIFLTSLWLIEQSRMMRAGEFLERLEDEINEQLKGPFLIWENWLRREEVPFFDVHQLHHYAQHIIIGMLSFIGYLSIGLILFIIAPSYPNFFLQIIFIAFIVINIFLLSILLIVYFVAIRHRHGKKTASQTPCYDAFKSKYKATHFFSSDDSSTNKE